MPELLAVIAIVLILISLLLPNLNSSREVARRAICLSQLHQHMLGGKAYSNDHSKLLPAMRESQKINGVTKQYTYADRLVLFNYISAYDVFYCPSQDINEYFNHSDPSQTPFFHGGVRLDYGVNHYGRPNSQTQNFFDTIGQHYDKPASPYASGTLRSDFVANQDAVCYSDGDADSSPWDIGGVSRGKKEWPLRHSFDYHAYKRHLGGYNAVGLDTSAVWRKGDVPSYEAWYLKRGRQNPYRP
ncbi:MAG: hypothetical protein WD768_01680 [Phycisphaeraceae bacterium]